MITLHHLEYSQSFRTLWLLEELGVDYELIRYNRDKKTKLAPPEYKAISPLGTAPVISDGDLTLAESNAITDYILDQHPNNNLRPAHNHPDRAQYLFWFHASQGSMMPIVLMEAVMRIMHQRVPFFLKPIVSTLVEKMSNGFSKPRMTRLLEQAEKDLNNRDWLGGDTLSAADISMIYPMVAAQSRGFLNEKYPQCLAWLARAQACESYKAAQKKDDRPSLIMSLS